MILTAGAARVDRGRRAETGAEAKSERRWSARGCGNTNTRAGIHKWSKLLLCLVADQSGTVAVPDAQAEDHLPPSQPQGWRVWPEPRPLVTAPR